MYKVSFIDHKLKARLNSRVMENFMDPEAIIAIVVT